MKKIKGLWNIPPWAVFVEANPEPGGGGEPPADPPADPPGEATPEFLSGHKEMLKDESARNILTRYKSNEEVYKALVETKQSMATGFRMPDELTDEQKTELVARVKKLREIPDDVDAYDLVRPSELDESVDLSNTMRFELRDFAAKEGLTKGGLQNLYERILYGMQRASTSSARKTKEAFAQQQEKTAEEMKTYWGPSEYERISKIMDDYTKSTALDDKEYESFEKLLDATGVRHHPLMWRLLGDAARRWEILEGNAKGVDEFQTSQGAQRLKDNQRRQMMYPNTPAYLGGGKPA